MDYSIVKYCCREHLFDKFRNALNAMGRGGGMGLVFNALEYLQ